MRLYWTYTATIPSGRTSFSGRRFWLNLNGRDQPIASHGNPLSAIGECERHIKILRSVSCGYGGEQRARWADLSSKGRLKVHRQSSGWIIAHVLRWLWSFEMILLGETGVAVSRKKQQWWWLAKRKGFSGTV